MFKVVIVFLLFMLILSMAASAISRFFRGTPPKVDKGQIRARCAHCGRVVVGTAPCSCGKG